MKSRKKIDMGTIRKLPTWSSEKRVKSWKSRLFKKKFETQQSSYFIFQDINLDDFETIEKLEELGSERLCELLMLRGLKTGGSTNERADRLLKVKGLERAEYPAELCAPR